MQIGRKMTELEPFEVLSVNLEHPVFSKNHVQKTLRCRTMLQG